MSGEHPPSSPTNVRWQVFGLACGASFLLYLHRYSWNIVGPKLQDEFHFSNTQAGFLFSLFYYTYACGQIPSGVFIDRFGPHKFLSAIAMAWSLALAGIAQSANILLIGAWRLAFGAAQAGCYPALTKVTRQWFPVSQRTTLQGWIATTFGRGGAAMSPIILGTVLMGWCGLKWQLALTFLSAAGLVYAVLFWTWFRNSPHEDPRVNEEELELIRAGSPPAAIGSETTREVLPARRAARSRSLRYFIAQQFLDAGSDVVFVSLIGTYFLQARGFDIKATGWLASLPLWGGALGGIFGGWLNDFGIRSTGNRRWTRSLVGFSGKLVGCVMLILIVQQTSGEMAAWLLLLAKFFSDWSQPTTWGMCTDLGGRFSATVFSIINTAGTAGGVVMPIAFGIILDWYTVTTTAAGQETATTDWSPLFVLLSMMYLASGVCWLLIDCTRSLDSEE